MTGCEHFSLNVSYIDCKQEAKKSSSVAHAISEATDLKAGLLPVFNPDQQPFATCQSQLSLSPVTLSTLSPLAK